MRFINLMISGSLLLLGACVDNGSLGTNPNNTDCIEDCSTVNDGDIAVPIIAPDTAGIPVVNGVELEPVDDKYTYWAYDGEVLDIEFQCPPNHLYSIKSPTVSETMDAIGWNLNGKTCEGGVAPNGVYTETVDEVEYNISTTENADGEIVMRGSNAAGLDPCITDNAFYGIDGDNNLIEGTFSNDVSTIQMHILAGNGNEANITLVR